MDLLNSETIPSSPSDILMKYYSNNASFRSTYRRQTFPFRDTLIRYITNNPSSANVYQKMIQSCKHFFIKNPIIVVPNLLFDEGGWYTQGSRPSKDRPNERSVYFIEITSKIWITDSLNVLESTPNCPVITSFMPQIYQSDATLIVIYHQMCSFNDLMVIASKCEILFLSNVVVMNNNEKVPETEGDGFETAISLEALFIALPNVKTFQYLLPDNYLNITTSKTAEELLKIPHFLSLEKFGISQIPEIFDNYSFFGHIKENKKTKIELDFSYQISDEYKTRLQTIVDEILETKNRDYKVPRINFSGITNSSNVKIRALYRQN
uniref:Uncharacterized protein n=1 Tax=Panagrolaimus davidi TaxID=227884 RepID=A0A914QLU4_9BILA